VNYYPRHVGDYLRDASHLTLLEHGIYARLMDVYYTLERACDGNALALRIGVRTEEERMLMDNILRDFFYEEGGVWRHKRCDLEIEKSKSRAQKASESASKRWSECQGNAKAMPTQCEGNANQKPKAKSQKPNNNNNSSLRSEYKHLFAIQDFEGVWEGYLQMRRHKKYALSPQAQKSKLRTLAQHPSRAITMLQCATEREWQGMEWGWLDRIASGDEEDPSAHSAPDPDWLERQHAKKEAASA